MKHLLFFFSELKDELVDQTLWIYLVVFFKKKNFENKFCKIILKIKKNKKNVFR